MAKYSDRLIEVIAGPEQAFAISQPEDVEINEILFRTTRHEL